MRSIKLFVFLLALLAVVPNFAQTPTPKPKKDAVPVQKTISDIPDSDFEDVQITDSKTSKKAKQANNQTTREYFSGAKGGCYYLDQSGKKKYVDKKFCVNAPANVTGLKLEVPKPTEPKPMADKPVEDKTTITITKEPTKKADTGGKTYIRGSKGGCYYLTESGKKIYVKDKTLCEGQ